MVGLHKLFATVAKEVKEETASELGMELKRKPRPAGGGTKNGESEGSKVSVEGGKGGNGVAEKKVNLNAMQ